MLGNHLDCPIHTFTHPQEALAALPALNPGVVVTDYSMPDLNGFDFIEQASTAAPGVRFIVISGHLLDYNDEDYAHLPALKQIIPKPFRWPILAQAILDNWPDDCPPQKK